MSTCIPKERTKCAYDDTVKRQWAYKRTHTQTQISEWSLVSWDGESVGEVDGDDGEARLIPTAAALAMARNNRANRQPAACSQ